MEYLTLKKELVEVRISNEAVEIYKKLETIYKEVGELVWYMDDNDIAGCYCGPRRKMAEARDKIASAIKDIKRENVVTEVSTLYDLLAKEEQE